MKVENINPVGLEWQEVIGTVTLWEHTTERGRIILGEYNFKNRSERKKAMGILTMKFRPYRRPKRYYWVVALSDPLNTTEHFTFNPKFT